MNSVPSLKASTIPPLPTLPSSTTIHHPHRSLSTAPANHLRATRAQLPEAAPVANTKWAFSSSQRVTTQMLSGVEIYTRAMDHHGTRKNRRTSPSIHLQDHHHPIKYRATPQVRLPTETNSHHLYVHRQPMKTLHHHLGHLLLT